MKRSAGRQRLVPQRGSLRSAGDCTEDTLFNGRLKCLQPRDGYRFSVDAVLLAHFVSPKPRDQILDLCAGCGVVSLLVAYRWPEVQLTSLEIQPRLADLARRNSLLNGFDSRMRVIEGDCNHINELIEPGSFELVLCNPPYRKPASGRRNMGEEQAIARHEIMLELNAVIKAIAFALKTRGRAAVVYPATRAGSLLAELKNNGLEPKRCRIVYSYPGGDGKLVLIEVVKGGGEELLIMPPFYIYKEAGGAYTEETACLYRP